MFDTPDRITLQTTLKDLLPAEFEQVLFVYNVPPAYLNRNAAQAEQAIDVVRYAESRNDLTRLAEIVAQQTQPQLVAVPPPAFVSWRDTVESRQTWLHHYSNDVLLCYAPSLKAHSDALLDVLDALLTQRLGRRGCYRLQCVENATPDLTRLLAENACTLVLVGAESEIPALSLHRVDSKRLFWLETVRGKVDEELRIWNYRLYSGDASLAVDDMRYRRQIEQLADELHDYLRRLRTEAEQRACLTAERQRRAQAASAQPQLHLPELAFFIDATPEDRTLLQHVEQLLDQEGVEYSVSIEPAHIQSAAEVDEDLKNNLSCCDVFLLVYGQVSSYLALRHRLTLCRRVERESGKPLLAMVVHNEHLTPDKPSLGMRFKNLHVFDCPPEAIEDYLPRCLQEVVGE